MSPIKMKKKCLLSILTRMESVSMRFWLLKSLLMQAICSSSSSNWKGRWRSCKIHYYVLLPSSDSYDNPSSRNSLYVLVMSRTRFRANPHSIVAWMSRNSLLETWLWVRVPLQSLKLQISRLFQVLTTQLDYLASSARWLSVHLKTKWLWVRASLQSLIWNLFKIKY